MKDFASVHDFESQLELLRTLHSWAESAARDIRTVYGPAIAVGVSGVPAAGVSNPAFSLTVSGNYAVTFALHERRRLDAPRWFISVTVSSGGPSGAIVAAGPERRNGQWTRARLEDVLLSVLGAYERSTSEGAKTGKPGAGLRARGA